MQTFVAVRLLCAAAFIALGSACAGHAPGAGTQAPAAPPDVTAAALETHIRVLGADSLEGRGTGTRGFDKAARYVAGHFAQLGLEPAGTDRYLQAVPLRRARVVEASLVLAGPSGRRELARDRDYIAVPNLLHTRSEVTAPLVLAGFGVTAPDHAYDDYRDIDARGKIVVLLTGAPASFPPTERAHYASRQAKAQNAVQHGAIGLLIVRTRDVSFPWDRSVRQARGGEMRWLAPDGTPSDVFPEIRAVAALSDTGAATLFEGATQSHAAVLSAAAEGRAPAFDIPLTATIRTVSTHERLESPNVAGLLRGSDARLRGEVVVFTAHLDHLGIGAPVRGDSIYNGVVDNASGSAALLEIARAFTRAPQRPRRSVLFLAVTGEEMGLLGSDHFVRHPTVPIDRIVANVNVDGLSMLYPLRGMVPYGAEHSTLDATVQRVAARMGIELEPDPFPQEVFFVRSDQYSFVRRGVPSLFLFMGLRSDSGVNGVARLREWMSSRYHTPQDDLGQPMNLEAGARHATLALLVGSEIANADERPAWKPGDFFGRMFGGLDSAK